MAEKPSIAKSITEILSGGQFEASNAGRIRNYEFDYPQTRAQFIVTAVAGHVKEHDFDGDFGWKSCEPFALFDARVKSYVPDKNRQLENNLKHLARRADRLMIWTDCDREGEHIGMEIVDIVRTVKRNIPVDRARFSAIIPQQIHNAAQHPVPLNQAQADAVEARTILDLKIGAAFTRMQTLNLQARFGQIAEGQKVISYGPCQFPTLGFVVAQYNRVKAFIPEPFWYIHLALSNPEDPQAETAFTWKRGHLFDYDTALVLYEQVLGDDQRPEATVLSSTMKPTKKWKPLPLTTVELQKAASRLLRIAPKKALDIAERLYQQGFLSYPRTETDQFDPEFDFMTLIQKQKADGGYGAFAAMLEQGGFQRPRNGRNNDKAHPPIHPTAHVANLGGDDKKVYDYIARRFLACCSQDAQGKQTTVEVECGGEEFEATGLIVLARNYLDVYPFDKWNGNHLPDFPPGAKFLPSTCELKEGSTTKPHLLTEADLVTLMDKNGIGTDATIAQHIATIVDRQYVEERVDGLTKYLIPSSLGVGLVEGYDEIGFEKSLSKPYLRRDTERSLVQICDGAKTKNELLTEATDQYKEMFMLARGEFGRVMAVSAFLFVFIGAQCVSCVLVVEGAA